MKDETLRLLVIGLNGFLLVTVAVLFLKGNRPAADKPGDVLLMLLAFAAPISSLAFVARRTE